MTAFIEEHRGTYGVEPMCKILQIAPSTYYDRRAIARDPDLASARAKSDAALSVKIDAAWEDNRKLYGARKIWHVLREGEDVARCTVERLMRVLGIRGGVRGKKVITTNPDASQPCPDDKVNRVFMADRQNKLWVSGFTYVPTWSGTVYVAFVIDVYARHWPNVSSACSRPRSSTRSAPGNRCARSNGKPSNGWIGITTAACLAPSDTSRPQKQRRRSMQT